MAEVLGLTWDIQIMLVAGYIGLLVSDMGRGVPRAGHDAVFRVLVFGLAARLPLIAVESWLPGSGTGAAFHAALMCLIGLTAGAFWRRLGRKAMAWLMRALGVYRDDHETSTWLSIVNAGKAIRYLEVRRNDGVVFQSDFAEIPKGAPLSLTFNDDGIGMYVTSIWSPDKDDIVEEKTPVSREEGFYSFDYFRWNSIERVTFTAKG